MTALPGRIDCLAHGEAGLEDRSPHPTEVWNRLHDDDARDRIVQLAMDETVHGSSRAGAARAPRRVRFDILELLFDTAFDFFVEAYGVKYDRAVKCLIKD